MENQYHFDDSLAKFISLAVQIYLAVLAITNSFRKLCLTAKENHVVWHKLDKYKTKRNKTTKCVIFPNEFLFQNTPALIQ